MDEPKYFYVEVGGHYECCKMTVHQAKNIIRCRIVVASCHHEKDVSLLARRAIAKHINEQSEELGLELGMWHFEREPERQQYAAAGGNCEEKRDWIMRELRASPELPPPRERLAKALAEKNRSRQKRQMKELLSLAKSLPASQQRERAEDEDVGYNSEVSDADADDSGDVQEINLRRDLLFAYHGTKWEHEIRTGIAALQKTDVKRKAPHISRMIDYRDGKKLYLDEVFKDNDGKAGNDSANDWWEERVGAAAARMVAEKTGASCSAIKREKDQREARRFQKLPYIILHIIDAWIPTVGVNAVIIFSALKGRAPLFQDTLRQIKRKDLRKFAHFVANRLGPLDMSNIKDCVPVFCPLVDLAWSLELAWTLDPEDVSAPNSKPFFCTICKRLKLINLDSLQVIPTSIYDNALRQWRIDSKHWDTMDEIQKALAQVTLEKNSRIELAHWRPTDGNINSAPHAAPATYAHSDFIPLSMSADSGYGGGGTDCPRTAPSSVSTPSGDDGESSARGGRDRRNVGDSEFISPRRLVPTSRPDSSQFSENLPTSLRTGRKRPRFSNGLDPSDHHVYGAGSITASEPNLEFQSNDNIVGGEPTQGADDVMAESGMVFMAGLDFTGEPDFSNFNFDLSNQQDSSAQEQLYENFLPAAQAGNEHQAV